MADDMYEDGGSTAVETPAEEKKDKSEGAATGLLDKTFFGDKELKPGERCEVEIDRVMDDQVLVHKVRESNYKDKDDAAPAPTSAVDSMMD